MKTPRRESFECVNGTTHSMVWLKITPEVIGTTHNCNNRRHTVVIIDGNLKLLNHTFEEYLSVMALEALGGEIPKCFKVFKLWTARYSTAADIEKAFKVAGVGKDLIEVRAAVHARGNARRKQAWCEPVVKNRFVNINSVAKSALRDQAIELLSLRIAKKLAKHNDFWARRDMKIADTIRRNSSWMWDFMTFQHYEDALPVRYIVRAPEGDVIEFLRPVTRGGYTEFQTQIAFRSKNGLMTFEKKAGL